MSEQEYELNHQDAKGKLRRLELEAYSAVVYSLRAQGKLDEEKRELLTLLRQQLCVSEDRHKAEIRRAVNDEELEQIADKLRGEDTSSGWSEEGKRRCPFVRPRVVPLKHLQNLINGGVATVTASVALGLADLPRNEAESPITSSHLQTSGLFGLSLSSSRATTSSPMSVAVAKLLEANANASSQVFGLDTAESHRKEMVRPTQQGATGGRRGTKRKSTTQKPFVGMNATSSSETGYLSPQYEAVNTLKKKLVASSRALDAQPMIDKPTISLPTSVSLSVSRSPVSVSLRQIMTPAIFHTSAHSLSVPSLAVVSTTSTVVPLNTQSATTRALESLSISLPSCAEPLTIMSKVSSVPYICPVTAVQQQQSALQLTPSLLDTKASLVTTSSVSLKSSVMRQQSATAVQPLYSQSVLSSQTFAATTTSQLASPSHLPVKGSLGGWVSCAVTASTTFVTTTTTTTAQLLSGTPTAMALVNQQSLKTLGNVYIVSSSDGQPGRAILLPHRGTSATPSAFSLIPVTAANILPSQSLHLACTSISGVAVSSLSGLTTFTVSIPIQTMSACSCAAPPVSSCQSITTSSISNEQQDVLPSATDVGQTVAGDFAETESPDSEVTQAAEELVQLQAGCGSSSDSTTALLLRNPSLLEATTTLLSLQTSAVAPVNRIIDNLNHDESKSQEQSETYPNDGDTTMSLEREENEKQQQVMLDIQVSDSAQGIKQDMVMDDNNIDRSAPEVFRHEKMSSTDETREVNSTADSKKTESIVQSSSESSVVISCSLVSASSDSVIVSLPGQLVSKDERILKSIGSTFTTSATTCVVSSALTTSDGADVHITHPSYSTSSSFTSVCSEKPIADSSSEQEGGSHSPHVLSSQTLQPAVAAPRQSTCLIALGSAVGHKPEEPGKPQQTSSSSLSVEQQQSAITSCSSLTTRMLVNTKQDTILQSFPVVSPTSLQSSSTPTSRQSSMTQPSCHTQQGLFSSSSTSRTGAIHLRIQGSTVTAQQPVATSLSANGATSQSIATSRNTQENTFQSISLPSSSSVVHATSVVSQPSFSDVHSMLDVFRDMTSDSQSQDESDADQLKSIIDELGVNLDDPESFLSSDHLSFETSLDPDILSDVFAAISAADTTVSHSSSSQFAPVPSLTNELTATRNAQTPSFDQPFTQAHRDNSRGNKGRGKRPSQLERSVSYSYPMTRPANIIATRRSSAAASLTDHADGDDNSGLRHSKRKRKLTAVMTDDPYPAPKTETITVPSWVKAALALMYRVCRVRGSNRPKSEASASSWFLDPVDLNEVPDYCEKVKRPMDFTTIKKKLEAGFYSHYSRWNADMQLVQQNCYTYNPPGHIVRIDCDEVFRFYNAAYEKLVERWQRTPELIEKTTTLQRSVEY